MDDSEDNLSAEDITKVESPTTLRLKSKKRSLVERELETNLTARVTSPVSNGEGTSTSRYGRARRLKTEAEFSDSRKIMLEVLKSSGPEKSPVKVQSPVYKMHASNSPIHLESPKKPTMEMYLDNQIENIYQENISLSRFGSEEIFKPSPVKKHPKIYIRKDLIQNRDPEETVMLIKNIFSPTKSAQKASNSHISNILERSSEKFNLSSSGRHANGHIDNLSVVKTLDFDNKKKKKDSKEKVLSKSDLFELEAKCLYQVGDLAWARMGTYPFWPCIVTRDPSHGIFVKKKLFGRIERDIIHVTFFGDNGRRGWIVDNMLKKFMGLAEFESAREKFTPEDKKRDPRLYAAFFISDKKQSLWNMSVHEAETLFKEPKRLRIDILNDMLEKARSQKTTPKTQKSGKITRTDSDVSLSESLYDTLFSEDDGKTDDSDRSRNKIRNKSLDVSEVVTACLDNMAAKTGITKIQRQSHMDRWLQKAKSKTPEKTHTKPSNTSKDNKSVIKQEHGKKKKMVSSKDLSKHYSLRRSTYESQNLLSHQNEHDYYNNLVSNDLGENLNNPSNNENDNIDTNIVSANNESQDDKEKNHVHVKYEDIMLETDSIIAHEIVLENERNSITDSEAENSSLNEINNVPFSEAPDMDIDSISDTQDSCFSTEKSTETETSDIDSQSQTDSTVLCNSRSEKNDKKDNGCFSTSSDDSTMSLQSCNTGQQKLTEKHMDNNKDFIFTDNSIDSMYTDISNKVDIDMVNIDGDQINGKKESIQSLSLQLGNEFNLGSTINSSNMDNSISEMSVEEDDTKEIISTNSNDTRANDEISVKDCIEKDTSTNDTFITVAELEESNQNGVVGESLTIEAHKMTIYDNTDVSFQNCINYNKCFYEDDGSKVKENTFTSEESQSDEENTVNTTSDNDAVAEIPNKNEDSVSDLINQNDCEVYNTYEDTDGGNSVNSNKSEVYPDISKSLTENKNIVDSNKVNLSNFNAKSDDDDVYASEIDGNSDVENLGIKKNSTSYENGYHASDSDFKDGDCDTASVSSEDSPTLVPRNRQRLQLKRNKESKSNSLEDPEFIKYLETSLDTLIDEHPELSYNDLVTYLHKTWLYEQSKKSDLKKSDSVDHSNFVKGLDEAVKKKRFIRKTNKVVESSKGKEAHEKKRYPENIVSMNCEKIQKIAPDMPVDVTDTQVLEENNKEVSPINVENLVDNCEVKIPQIHSNNSVFRNHLMESDTVTNQEKSSVKLEKSDETVHISRMSSQSDPERDTEDSEEKKECIESTIKKEFDIDKTSMDSEVSDIPLIYRKLQLKAKPESILRNLDNDQNDVDADNMSMSSEDSDRVLSKRKQKIRVDKKLGKGIDDPEFIKYLELRQDALIDENPQLNQDEITNYLFKTWLYEENVKHELKKTDEIEQLGLVKGLQDERIETAPPKRAKKKIKVPRDITDFFEIAPRNKPQRSTVKHYYNEDLFDLEDEIESFEITKDRREIKTEIIGSPNDEAQKQISVCSNEVVEYVDQTRDDNVNEVELYFAELTQPKPNIFKGLVREKVCDICEQTGNLVKCKSCHGMFHVDCVKKQTEVIDVPVPSRGRKKKRKAGRRPKGLEDIDNHGDDKIQDLSEEHIDDFEPEARTVDAEVLEAQLSAKMKEILDNLEPPENFSYSSDEEIDWRDSVPGKCEIIDVKLKLRTAEVLDFSDFKCNNCQKYDTPVCFVCKSAISKKESKMRQRCQVPHCHKFYHIDCLEHWPQTQFNAGEPSKNNKKINEHFEALTCPRHVCHTCVSDDPRGCKTRFSGDKLAKCVRCPATYHSFTKCIPAGTQILTASHIICPRHYEHRPGKVPCHVNTGWCFICALGGSLICCEYCPTSFHAECLNIDPPEGGYMCEDCETGRLPLYGEMVWVKLGHYRWWPGIILHPSEIPLNILAVKHRLGEFVVRFFGQYDHYWVNRGRVFPFQEGDSGRISSQRSKIDAAFTMAMEHAQRACEILKSAAPNEEESLDIASSLLPPHYVKLKVNKPCGSLCGRKLDDPELSLTQCECNPDEEDPCGLYSQCLNRMLLTECGPLCKAGDRCNNRAFEKRLYPKLVPYRTPHRGWGLKTLDDIKSGQFVIEYVGELIDEEEFKRRMRRKHEIRDENFYFLTLDKERMIDAGPKGNLARFMNHCCEPNCETQKWTVLGDVRVGLFAIKDIPANTEVTFNYNLECAGIEKKRCLCGAKRCSGYIGAKPKQDESQTKKGKVPAKRTYKKQKAETPPSATKPKPKRPLGRPPKPKELSEIEKDLLIIRNATNGLSSDESCRSLSSEGDRNPKALKRKRVSFSTEEVILYNGSESPSLKRQKLFEKDVGD